ncbi:MAG TPA: hypothetical protein VHD32_18820 [Candidatus Didemnitutus sp.]|nr:hypothetical protein [Candidatus Didemnitutus sp.]
MSPSALRNPNLTLAPVPSGAKPSPMPDRLQELQQQRARLLEVLKWIEQEIIAESARSGRGASALPSPTLPAVAPRPVRTASRPPGLTEADAELILEQYREESQNAPQSVRTGCFLYFGLALGLLVASVLAWYFLTPKR